MVLQYPWLLIILIYISFWFWFKALPYIDQGSLLEKSISFKRLLPSANSINVVINKRHIVLSNCTFRYFFFCVIYELLFSFLWFFLIGKFGDHRKKFRERFPLIQIHPTTTTITRINKWGWGTDWRVIFLGDGRFRDFCFFFLTHSLNPNKMHATRWWTFGRVMIFCGLFKEPKNIALSLDTYTMLSSCINLLSISGE